MFFFNPLPRLRAKLILWKSWRKRKRERLSYKNEVWHLRRELVVLYQKSAAMEMLFISKQEKINRLLMAMAELYTPADGDRYDGLYDADTRPEIVITSFDRTLTQLSNDFDERQREYEQTGKRDRQERVLTKGPDQP